MRRALCAQPAALHSGCKPGGAQQPQQACPGAPGTAPAASPFVTPPSPPPGRYLQHLLPPRAQRADQVPPPVALVLRPAPGGGRHNKISTGCGHAGGHTRAHAAPWGLLHALCPNRSLAPHAQRSAQAARPPGSQLRQLWGFHAAAQRVQQRAQRAQLAPRGGRQPRRLLPAVGVLEVALLQTSWKTQSTSGPAQKRWRAARLSWRPSTAAAPSKQGLLQRLWELIWGLCPFTGSPSSPLSRTCMRASVSLACTRRGRVAGASVSCKAALPAATAGSCRRYGGKQVVLGPLPGPWPAHSRRATAGPWLWA